MDVGKAYTVLQRVVETGYDMAGVSISGIPVVLKTITPLEISLARQHSFGGELKAFRLYLLAYHTLMIKGKTCIEERPSSIEDLVDFYKELPQEVLELVEETAYQLQKRYRRYMRLIEGFTLSDSSRTLWKLRKGNACINEETTGIPGSTYIGVSECTLAWSIVNTSLDQNEEYERGMEEAMFIASASNPKGVDKISKSMEVSKKEAQERKRILIKYGSMIHKDLIEGREIVKKEKWTSSVTTSEDLVKELNRQMKGEKDRHDLFMESYLERIKKAAEEEQRKAEEKLREIRENRKLVPLPTGSFELTPEDRERMKSKEVTAFDLATQKRDNSLKGGGQRVSTVGKRVLKAGRR